MPSPNPTSVPVWSDAHAQQALVRLCELAAFAYERSEYPLGGVLARLAGAGPWGGTVQNEREFRQALRDAGFDKGKIDGEISLVRRRTEEPR